MGHRSHDKPPGNNSQETLERFLKGSWKGRGDLAAGCMCSRCFDGDDKLFPMNRDIETKQPRKYYGTLGTLK